MDERLGKNLTRLLRHGAKKEGLGIRSDGFVDVEEVLGHRSMRQRKCTLADIQRVVENDKKGRYILRQDDATDRIMIKATQGHSIQLPDLSLRKVTDPASLPMVVHGTYLDCWEKIKKEGLRRMKRTHIHFTTSDVVGAETNSQSIQQISGFRSNCDVLIYIDVTKAMEEGLTFCLSENNVVLSSGLDGIVAPKFFQKAINRRTGELLCTTPSH